MWNSECNCEFSLQPRERFFFILLLNWNLGKKNLVNTGSNFQQQIKIKTLQFLFKMILSYSVQKLTIVVQSKVGRKYAITYWLILGSKVIWFRDLMLITINCYDLLVTKVFRLLIYVTERNKCLNIFDNNRNSILSRRNHPGRTVSYPHIIWCWKT